MGDAVQKIVEFRDIMAKLPTSTHRIWEFNLKKINVHLLEMEDVLFHHNSAVIMPSSPEESPKDQKGSDKQEKVTGLKSLALIFKLIDYEPDKRLLIAGHTDTSGKTDYNFGLSALRARNILYLFTGGEYSRGQWAEIGVERHKIEDYQQIMKHYAGLKRWPCDPLKVNDSWNKNTETAVDNFIKSYNSDFAPANNEKAIPGRVFNDVKKDSKHLWPLEIWVAVYNLYNEELAKILKMTTAQLQDYRDTKIKFASMKNKYVACGESFPIDKAQKGNYRSQTNRRVEILLFDKNEIPVINCPADITKVHKEKDCPIWHRWHFIPKYIHPDDLHAVVYHMSFSYYNRVRDEVMNLPEGLDIRAFENNGEELSTAVSYTDGVYSIRVRFKTPVDDGTHQKLYFEFKTENLWVYTDSKDATPKIVIRTPEQIKELNKPEKFIDRWKYYDLPAYWSSRNYWTRYEGDMNKGERYEKVVSEKLQLKPFGGKNTSAAQPLTFSLDDIVLLDQVGGTQVIKDANHKIPAVVKDLSEKSRVKIFLVNKANGCLRLHQKTSDRHSARRPFLKEKVGGNDVWRNLIIEDPEKIKRAKVVFFRNGFYAVGDKRTTIENNWVNKGAVIGARAAVRNDSDFHISFEMDYNDHDYGSTGDYDLHYFHHQHLEGKNPVSFTIAYVSISFMRDSRDPATVSPVPGANDVKMFVDKGVYNAMDTWNRKRAYLEEDPANETSTIIRPTFFFDERETFEIQEPAGGFKLDFDKRPSEDAASNHKKLFDHANMATAQDKAIGGRSKFLALICKDGSLHYGQAYQWSIRSEGPTHYSLFKLNKSAYRTWSTPPDQAPVTEHGDSFGVHTFAHELGHATGQPDEYVRRDDFKPDPGQNYKPPDFAQFYIPYSMSTNSTSMMNHNRAPRLHHLWYPMHRLNKEISDASKPLSKMLPGKKFIARLSRGGIWELKYQRNLTASGRPQIPEKLTDPVYTEPLYQVRAAPLKRLKLDLYYVGEDESSIKYFHNNQEPLKYQAVLLVRLMLSVKFAPAMANLQRALRIYQLEQAWVDLGGHYRLTGGTKDIKNIYIHFLPGFSESWTATVNSGGVDFTPNYWVEFRNDNAPAAPNPRIPNNSGGIFAHLDVDADELVRYFVNAAGGSIIKNDLNFLKTWVNAKLTDNFTLESF
nr:hypothetical protein [candidate division Zixibacteria bacterium]